MLRCLIPDLPPPSKLLPFLREMHQARWYSNFGPLERRFLGELKQQLAERDQHSDPIQGCLASSGTSALQLALVSLNLPPESRVLVPTLTFPATATAVLRCGLTPVLTDVDPHSWLMTPEIALRTAERHGASAVVPVAAFGQALDTTAWDDFSAFSGLPVLIDAAGAYADQAVGQRLGVAYSFHATKALGIGEGGGLFSRNELWIARAKRHSNFGFRHGVVGRPGENGKLSEYHAAVGLAQLQRWERVKSRRQLRQRWYDETLDDMNLPVVRQAGARSSAPTLYLLGLPGGSNVAFDTLRRQGIETRRWYCPPLHRQPIGQNHCVLEDAYPVAEPLGQRLLGLPFHSFLKYADVQRVCHALSAHLDAQESKHGYAR